MYFMCGFYIIHVVSSLLDHDIIIKYMMIFFPHYLGFLLYTLVSVLRMYTSSPCWFPMYELA